MTALERANGAPVGFPFESQAVRAHLGLNREEERGLRQGLGEEKWRVFKKRVWLSEAAVALLAAAAGVEIKIAPESSRIELAGAPGAELDPEKSAAETETPAVPVPRPRAEPVDLKVVRADLANRHLVLACGAGEDPERPQRVVRVRVRSAEGLRRGMALRGRLVAGYDDLYDVEGRLPRRKGKGQG